MGVLSCFSHVQPYATLWTIVCQALLSMGFFRQEYWSGLPISSRRSSQPGDQTCVSYVSCIGRWEDRNRFIIKTHYILSSRGWTNGHSHDTAVMPPLSGWSSHIPTAQSDLWPSEYLVMCMHSAINDLSCYIVIIYKMWSKRAWTCHLG